MTANAIFVSMKNNRILSLFLIVSLLPLNLKAEGTGGFMKPVEYIVNLFDAGADVVLLAEDHGVRENLEFVCNLIPELYSHGVHVLGMEFGASEDQKVLDSLLAAPEYDEQLARELMFRYNCSWAIKEYTDLYRAAWDFNRTLGEGECKFRILNISYIYNWENFDGIRTPETMSAVFPKGNTEKYRADIIEDSVLSKAEKILILTGTIHAFTYFRYPYYDYTSPGFTRYDEGYMGQLLYRSIGDRVKCVCLHQPFPGYPGRDGGWVQPAGGKLEEYILASAEGPVAFSLEDNAAGHLIDSSYYSMGSTGLTLMDLFDGYVFLKPLSRLTSCTLDTLFAEGHSFEEIYAASPDPDWHPRPADMDDFWRRIRAFMDIPARYRGL